MTETSSCPSITYEGEITRRALIHRQAADLIEDDEPERFRHEVEAKVLKVWLGRFEELAK